jgi:uncharacterized damage-inducible protein DinB
MPRPTPGTFPAYFERYISLVDANDVKEAIEKYSPSLIDFFSNIPADKYDYRYAEGKWTVKELLQHIIDAERIFAYRALRIARQDQTPLPGFDENLYATASSANSRSWESLLEEFAAVRKATDLLLESFNDEQLNSSGVTNDSPNTVNAIGFIVFGHLIHHKNILQERYLS